jgi:hypothetical protein
LVNLGEENCHKFDFKIRLAEHHQQLAKKLNLSYVARREVKPQSYSAKTVSFKN